MPAEGSCSPTPQRRGTSVWCLGRSRRFASGPGRSGRPSRSAAASSRRRGDQTSSVRAGASGRRKQRRRLPSGLPGGARDDATSSSRPFSIWLPVVGAKPPRSVGAGKFVSKVYRRRRVSPAFVLGADAGAGARPSSGCAAASGAVTAASRLVISRPGVPQFRCENDTDGEPRGSCDTPRFSAAASDFVRRRRFFRLAGS